MNGILGNTKILEKALDASVLRNESISQNIANVDTPGYKRKKVMFEEFLHSEMGNNFIGKRTNEKHIQIGSGGQNNPSIIVKEDHTQNNMRLDGNNVDIDTEMSLMAENQIKYNVLIQRLNGSFSKLRHVISEGRR